ncbi:hypothetical protein ACM39_00730 [Chryseobacterium sp. FH2]|uniref:hypothetical protein n=1 Tax=Chryseobacterium sp. FH2 TaxID=1674291 RepID=UPI00065A97DA|nr:hypothetical protein [Chryseobacterium sp. FH2]KMQ69624.1 hypothetical protein ACM39_00730 [Chryseobacterium sp. FH2]
MEKFQKYCLSVLLVIIYSNISAQIPNDAIEHNDCKKICEIYSQFFCHNSQAFFIPKKTSYQTFSQKGKAVDIVNKFLPEIQQNAGFNKNDFEIAYHEGEKHNISRINFEKQKNYSFFESTYLKNKVSKIRNKDYLDLKI